MTTRFSERARACAAALAIALLVVPSSSLAAPPSAADVESARSLYVLGKELRDSGDLAASFEHFKAAHALVATPITALELGRAYALLGKPLEARAVLLTIDRMPAAPDESRKAAASRDDARELADELAALTPSLMIEVAHPRGAELVVAIDGERVPTEALAVPRKVNPGKHVVSARIGQTERIDEVTVAERETRKVTLDLRDAVVEREPAALAESSPPTSDGPWLVIALATAGASAAIGTGTGIFAWAKSDRLHEACVDGQCPPEVHADLAAVQTTSTIATFAFGTAAVALVAATTFWLLSPRRTKPSTAALVQGRW